MPMNLRYNSSKFQVISNCYKRLYSLVVMTTRLQKNKLMKKRNAECTFQGVRYKRDGDRETGSKRGTGTQGLKVE